LNLGVGMAVLPAFTRLNVSLTTTKLPSRTAIQSFGLGVPCGIGLDGSAAGVENQSLTFWERVPPLYSQRPELTLSLEATVVDVCFGELRSMGPDPVSQA